MINEDTYKKHITVLLQETIDPVLETANKKKAPLLVDLTFGGGGHTLAMADQCKNARIISFDKDPQAHANGLKKIADLGLSGRITLVHDDFVNASKILKEKFNLSSVDGIIADLGVSSHHFDDSSRGFSFVEDGPLDMRMNIQDTALMASDIVNEYSEEDIATILRDFGEEMFARKIAHNIVLARAEKRIETTRELEAIVFHSYPTKFKKNYRTHPATKTFQALRIAVNSELDHLSQSIPQLLEMLSAGARLAIITFHSLEDRIVKHSFRSACVSNEAFGLLTKKPIYPTEDEIKFNPRSRSAKLRVIERVDKNA